MNELSILATQDKKTVTTRELAQTLGVDVRTIQRLAEKLFDINVVKSVSTGGRPTMCFTEEQATAIKIELQNHSKVAQNGFNTLSISNDLEMMLLQRKLAEYQDKRIVELEEENKKMSQKLIEQSPKVDFYNDVTGSKDTLDMSQTARLINIRGMGRNKIFECLREKGIFDRNNQPYQKYIDTGYFRIIESKYTTPQGDVRINLKTVVFQKGVEFIKKTLEESIKENETMEAV